jgi:hypothetical protein
MAFLLKLKGYVWALGAFALSIAGLVLRIKYLEKARSRAEDRAHLAEARAHVRETEKRIEKKNKEEFKASLKEAEKEIEKKGEEFEGVDNLSNPNDW